MLYDSLIGIKNSMFYPRVFFVRDGARTHPQRVFLSSPITWFAISMVCLLFVIKEMLLQEAIFMIQRKEAIVQFQLSAGNVQQRQKSANTKWLFHNDYTYCVILKYNCIRSEVCLKRNCHSLKCCFSEVQRPFLSYPQMNVNVLSLICRKQRENRKPVVLIGKMVSSCFYRWLPSLPRLTLLCLTALRIKIC